MNENLLSWNLPNFVSVVLMLAIVWIILGAAGHIFVRSKSGTGVSGTTFSKLNPVPVAAVA